jgi:hypothetical protein
MDWNTSRLLLVYFDAHILKIHFLYFPTAGAYISSLYSIFSSKKRNYLIKNIALYIMPAFFNLLNLFWHSDKNLCSYAEVNFWDFVRNDSSIEWDECVSVLHGTCLKCVGCFFYVQPCLSKNPKYTFYTIKSSLALAYKCRKLCLNLWNKHDFIYNNRLRLIFSFLSSFS